MRSAGQKTKIIDPEQLSELLSEDASGLLDHVSGKLISLDGKKMRGVSPTSRGNKGMYILSAWVGEHRLCLGQKRVKDKSNEITAIPELIDAMDIEGGIVSIDAMGCQTQIATKIISSKADYLLAVKENQGGLYEEVTHPLSWSSVNQSGIIGVLKISYIGIWMLLSRKMQTEVDRVIHPSI